MVDRREEGRHAAHRGDRDLDDLRGVSGQPLAERGLDFSGRWSGTRRMATLRLAVAGTMVFIPGPP